jgi:signal transduction histidine kinase
MRESLSDRLGTAAGLVACLAVGVPMAGMSLVGDPPVQGAAGAVWWASYLVHLAAFAYLNTERRPVPIGDRVLLLTMVITASGVFLVLPGLGWNAVLFVVNAATAGFVLHLRGVIGVVVVQTLVIVVGSVPVAPTWLEVVLAAGVYLGFQGFAVLAVQAEVRQARTSAALAAANAELRATTALLAESSRATERLRIARELHDLVGHQLTGLVLELEVADRKCTAPADEHVSRARDVAKDLLRDVRVAVGDLRAPVPGLRTALQAMAATYGDLSVHVDIDPDADLDLDEAAATALLRCAQEAVTNAARHAAASNIWIVVRHDGDRVALHARDDGRGVAVLHLGNGLRGMRERLEALGGGIELDPAGGRGFSLTARVPVG